MFEGFLVYILAVNVAAFAAMAIDKRRAERGLYRIPERTLLFLAVIGGTFGAIAGQQILNHKSRKEPFRTWLWVIAVAQPVALTAIYLCFAPTPAG